MFQHWLSWGVFWLHLVGYLVGNWAVVAWVYRPSPSLPWKSQPERSALKHPDGSFSELLAWWPPMEWALVRMGAVRAEAHERRHPQAALLACVNLFNICLAAAVVTELSLLGKTALRLDGEVCPPGEWLGWFFVAYWWENVAEWIWHRTLHVGVLYRWIHHLHHHNKAPEPFDDMLINPLEAVGYYAILFAPAFFPMPASAFVAYIAVMGLCGIADHSGVRFFLPFSLYDAEHHDAHHEFVNTNYGFPSALMDVLCGTFTGRCCGRHMRSIPQANERVPVARSRA